MEVDLLISLTDVDVDDIGKCYSYNNEYLGQLTYTGFNTRSQHHHVFTNKTIIDTNQSYKDQLFKVVNCSEGTGGKSKRKQSKRKQSKRRQSKRKQSKRRRSNRK